LRSATRFHRNFGAACAAVLISSADTYVVVLVLPAMMATFGVSLSNLQQATPIVSGYLLGYIAVLPLIGQLSDNLGRKPLFYFAFLAFAAGSVVTASSTSLGVAVVGRAVQGLGGGALLPLTFAVAADHWGTAQRAVPIGAIGGAQELGSLVGPLYGALVVTLSSWQTVFWLNCPLIGAAFAVMATGRTRDNRAMVLASAAVGASVGMAAWPPSTSTSAITLVPGGVLVISGLALLAQLPWRGPRGRAASCLAWLGVSAMLLQAVSPASLLSSPTYGQAWVTGFGRLSPLEWAGVGLGLAAAWLAWSGRRPAAASALVLRRIDYAGVGLVGGILSVTVVAFSTADPARSLLPAGIGWVGLGVAAALGALVLVERRAPYPLLPFRAFSSPKAWGSLVASFALGAALIVVLVDVPLFARATSEPRSQLGAALVLLRFLAGVPVGALAGGLLARLFGPRVVAAAGALLAGGMLGLMSTWGSGALSAGLFGLGFAHASDPVLVLCGVGMGTTISPLTTSLLNAIAPGLYGLAASLVVVARMVGMVIGVSLLTTVGLHAFSARAARLPPPSRLCPAHPLSCPRYDNLFSAALTSELGAIFFSAALACGVALVVALLTLEARGHEPLTGDDHLPVPATPR
jgi:MFS family permease